MECPICFWTYSKDLPPYMLSWGHPYWLQCLKQLCSNNIIKCALWKQKHKVSSTDKLHEKLVVNLSILNKIEFEEEKKEPCNRYSISVDQEDGLNVEIPLGFKCTRHNKIVHSYVVTNNVLMCSDCIASSQYDSTKIAPIPQFLKQINTSLHSTKIK